MRTDYGPVRTVLRSDPPAVGVENRLRGRIGGQRPGYSRWSTYGGRGSIGTVRGQESISSSTKGRQRSAWGRRGVVSWGRTIASFCTSVLVQKFIVVHGTGMAMDAANRTGLFERGKFCCK